MGAVSDYLHGLVQRQVKDHGLVVWFDPEGHYREFVEGLSLPDTTVETCGESFFDLRRRIEPRLGADGDRPPRLVVYVPRSEEETRDALVELTGPGVVVKPGQPSINRNTRLSVVAKTALRPVLGNGQAAKIEKEVAAGRLNLAELDELDNGPSTVLGIVFGTAHPQEVALKFLGSGRYDSAVAEKQAVPDLASRLGGALGASLSGEASCDELRISLARHVLLTEFVRSISGPLPRQLSSVKVADEEAAAEACAALVHEWRNRRDLKESYADHADRVEGELGVGRMDFDVGQLRGCETFAGVELALQTAVEEMALGKPEPSRHLGLRELIGERLRGFWASWPERYGQILPRWLLVQAAVEVIHAATTVEDGLKTVTKNPKDILERYAGDLSAEEPWCDLDTHHRSLERRDLDFARGIGDEYPALEKLITRARQRYREAGESLSEHYLRALQGTKFDVPDVPRQTETYATRVAPTLNSGGKVAYILVDSLRYEMARDIARRLDEDFGVELSLALGTVPTITEIGMAALMPGAEVGAKVVPVSEGRLGLEVKGNVLRNRQDRIKHLEEQLGRASKTVYETKLDDLLNSRKMARAKTKVEAADLIFVTSGEIDEQGELGNVSTARRFMDDVLSTLPRAVKVLAGLGCDTVVIAADHGYLFGDELGSDTKIDPPGGNTKDLHRRVWVGVGGTDEPSFLRVPLARVGAEDLDAAVPWGFGAFKSPGGSAAYFHGGMSLQEMVIPVLSLKLKGATDDNIASEIHWELSLNSKKISTRFVSVLVGGRAASLLEPALPRVRVEVRIGGKVVSEPVSATYDFSDTALDVGLRLAGDEIEANTVTLMIDSDAHPEARSGTASVHLLDATTGAGLTSTDGVEIDISI